MTQYLSIVLGFLYCIFIFWNRLIRERLPRDLFSEYNFILLCLYIFLFVICFYVTLYYIRQIFNIIPKYKILNRMLTVPMIANFSNRFLNIWNQYIVNAPKNFYEFLYNQIYIRPFIDKCCRFISYFVLQRFINYFIIFKYSFILILTTIFILNIFFLHNL